MIHGQKKPKLQRRKSQREALLKNLCKQLIIHRRIRTTLAKAKALRPVAEKLVTYGKNALAAKGKDARETTAISVHYRRMAFRKLRDETLVKKLVDEIAAVSKDRQGGYTRITKLGQRFSDSAPMAFIEWVDAFVPKTSEAVSTETAEQAAPEPEAVKPEKKAAKPRKAPKDDKSEAEAKPKAAKKAKPKKSAE